MKAFLSHWIVYCKVHRGQSVSVLYLLLLGILLCIQITPINLHYQISLSGAETTGEASFIFDDNPGYSKSAIQNSLVETVDNAQQASIHLDPLNNDSSSLTIVVPGEKAQLNSLTVTARINDQLSYHVTSVGSEAFVSDSNTYSVKTEMLRSIQRWSGLKSEAKIMMIALLTTLYVILIARLTVCSRISRLLFTAGTCVVLLVFAFVANLALLREPIVRHPGVSDPSSVVDLKQKSRYTIKQQITLPGDAADIHLPVSIDENIAPSDTSNEKYDDIYHNVHEFVDRYRVSVVSDNGHIYYDGIVSPEKLNDAANAIDIPLPHIPSGANVYVNLNKLSDRDPTLVFLASSKLVDGVSMNRADMIGVKGDAVFFDAECGIPGFPYRIVIVLVLAGFSIILLINLCAFRSRWKKSRSPICVFNYVALSAYSAIQILFYTVYVRGFADEGAHLSYIAYMFKNRRLIPDFSQMRKYDTSVWGVVNLGESDGLNYLGHPPLYYQFMAFLGRLHSEGNVVTYNYYYIHALTICIGLAATALIFYIGYTRLPRIPLLHLLFGLIVISAPNFLYGISGISNDTLTILTVTVFVLGIIRFCERRFNILTFLLIAVGISASLLTKLTAGLIVGVIAVLVVLHFIITDSSRKILLGKSFLLTIPIYLIPIAYFAVVYNRYNVLQPSWESLDYGGYLSRSGFYSGIDARGEMGVWSYVTQYIKLFMSTWYGLAGFVGFPRRDIPLYSIDRIALVAILVLPLAVFLFKKADRRLRYLQFGVIGIVVAFAIQIKGIYDSVMFKGRMGGFSSRYYLCAIVILALAILWVVCKIFLKKASGFSHATEINTHALETNDKSAHMYLTSAGKLLISIFIILLVFDGFIYSVLYNMDQMALFLG
jgi:hypothetical protein